MDYKYDSISKTLEVIFKKAKQKAISLRLLIADLRESIQDIMEEITGYQKINLHKQPSQKQDFFYAVLSEFFLWEKG